MKKIILIAISLFQLTASYSQTDSLFKVDSLKPENRPAYIGGDAALLQFLKSHLNYPEHTVPGTCYVKFIVKKDGSIGETSIVRGNKECPQCDQEAIRVVRSMPKWNPGTYDGKNVDAEYLLPIRFALKEQRQ